MRKWTEDACESLDASFFSGDEFYNVKSLEEINTYLYRWNRKALEIELMLAEMEGEK